MGKPMYIQCVISSYASAVECAEQVVLEDRKLSNCQQEKCGRNPSDG